MHWNCKETTTATNMLRVKPLADTPHIDRSSIWLSPFGFGFALAIQCKWRSRLNINTQHVMWQIFTIHSTCYDRWHCWLCAHVGQTLTPNYTEKSKSNAAVTLLTCNNSHWLLVKIICWLKAFDGRLRVMKDTQIAMLITRTAVLFMCFIN